MEKLRNALNKYKPNRDMVLLKLLLFTYSGAISCVVPYLAVHMKQIGISIEATAVIHAFLPVSMLLGPPTTGYIADKFGGHKLLLLVCLFFTALFHTSLLWVPSAGTQSQVLEARLSCTKSPDASLSLSLANWTKSADRHLTFENCIRACHPARSSYTILSGTSEGSTESSNFCGVFQVQPGPAGSVPKNVCLSVEAPPSETFHVFATSPDSTGWNRVVTLKVPNKNESKCDFNSSEDCAVLCKEEPDVDEMITNLQSKGGDPKVTFWIYLVLRATASVFVASCFSLFDATTMVMIKQHKTEYGKQKIWPVLATAIFPPITGFLVDYFTVSSSSDSERILNYSPPFYMMDMLLLCTMATCFFVQVTVNKSSDTSLRNAVHLMKNPRVAVLVVTVLLLGTLWGYIEVFLYWFLLELKSPTYLLGLTLTVGSGIGIPILFYAESIIKAVGHVTIVFVAFLFYAIRYTGYSYLNNPWWSLIFEAMEIFTAHLLWVSVVTYVAEMVPSGLLATMQGVVGGTHYGIGRGSGSLVGGLLMSHFGTRATFRFMGIAAITCGVIFLLQAIIFQGLTTNVTDTKANSTNEDSSRKAEKGSENAVQVETSNSGV